MQDPALERHYRVKDLVQLWNLSADTITRMFRDEPGVLVWSNEGKGKRVFSTLSIPESVVRRVHERLGHRSLQTELPRSNPPRVIRLRDLHSGMPKQAGHVIKRETCKKLSNRERIA